MPIKPGDVRGIVVSDGGVPVDLTGALKAEWKFKNRKTGAVKVQNARCIDPLAGLVEIRFPDDMPPFNSLEGMLKISWEGLKVYSNKILFRDVE